MKRKMFDCEFFRFLALFRSGMGRNRSGVCGFSTRRTEGKEKATAIPGEDKCAKATNDL